MSGHHTCSPKTAYISQTLSHPCLTVCLHLSWAPIPQGSSKLTIRKSKNYQRPPLSLMWAVPPKRTRAEEA